MQPGTEIYIQPAGLHEPWPFGTLIQDDGIIVTVKVLPRSKRQYRLKPAAVNRGGVFRFIKAFDISRLCDKDGLPLV